MSNGPNTSVKVDTSYLSEGWEILKRRAWVFIGYSLITGVIGYALNILWALVLPTQATVQPESMDEILDQIGPQMGMGIVTSLINQIIFSAFMAGLIIFCVREIRTRDARFSDIFEGFNFLLPAFAVVFITSLATFVGLLACLVGALFTTALCMFALPLVVDRNRGPMGAISESWRTLGPQWGSAGLFYFLAFLISISGLLICCIGVMWTAPFTSIAAAVLYTRFYDTAEVEQSVSPYPRPGRSGYAAPPAPQQEETLRPPTDEPPRGV